MMMRSALATGLAFALAAVSFLPACGQKNNGTGMVVDSGGATPTVVAEAGAVTTPTTDLSQCAGCQMPAPLAWTFEGIYSDAACTEPLAQSAVASCATIAPLAQTPFTYVDAVGLRRAGENATVTLAEIATPGARFRKTPAGCVKANESGTLVTPPGCSGQRVCRDAQGALTCNQTACRTLSNGCPNFEDTRMYATITDPGLKAKAGGGGGNLAACCAALVAEAKRLGPSPEAGVIMSIAVQCQAIAAQAGPNGTAPELGALRAAMAGRNVPAICKGL